MSPDEVSAHFAEIRAGWDQLFQVTTAIVADLQRENASLRQENALLEARLEERRNMPSVPVAAPTKASDAKKRELTCLNAGCGNTFVAFPNRKFCNDCLGARRRELRQVNFAGGVSVGNRP